MGRRAGHIGPVRGPQQPKPCLAKLYGEIYNDWKPRLVKAVVEPGYSVVVEHKAIPKSKLWKRNKHTFFVYRQRFVGHPSETTEVCTYLILPSGYYAIHALTQPPTHATSANGPRSSAGKRMLNVS
jgi:hypothetical protein